MLSKESGSVIVREVGLRDGLQSITQVLATPRKIGWLKGVHAAGIREIEVGSFVPPRLMPQFSDIREIVAAARDLEGLTISTLVPNLRGAADAFASGVDAVQFPLSASHAHSLANVRKTPNGMIEELARIRDLRDGSGSRCTIEVGISTAFGCTIQGAVPPEEVLRLLAAAVAAGADEVGLADTVGYADPAAVKCLVAQSFEVVGDKLSCGHFHDTRGLGLANVFAAWEAGIRRFDASLGGLGGCPHAPGASGNVSTEDLAYMFTSMGVVTGVSMPALLSVRQRLGSWLPGQQTFGAISCAGLPKTMKDHP